MEGYNYRVKCIFMLYYSNLTSWHKAIACDADHVLCRGVGMRRSFKASAICRADTMPLAASSLKSGARSLARLSARLDCVARPRAWASRLARPPRSPPSFLPRAFAAANAALVRVEIIPASSSATAAICWIMKRPVGPSSVGKSANLTVTPASRSAERKLTDLVSLSTFATTSGRWRKRAAARARCSCGLSHRRPLSISVYSSKMMPSAPRNLLTASRCAASPRPDWPCRLVDTR